MPTRVQCPNGHRIVAPDDKAGKTGKCPTCKAIVQITVQADSTVSDVYIEIASATPAASLEERTAKDDLFGSLPPLDDWASSAATTNLFDGSVATGRFPSSNTPSLTANSKANSVTGTVEKSSDSGLFNKHDFPLGKTTVLSTIGLTFGILCGLAVLFLGPKTSSSIPPASNKVDSETLMDAIKEDLFEAYEIDTSTFRDESVAKELMQFIDEEIFEA